MKLNPEPATTGLPSRVAAPLAYAGWWVTGVIFWVLEHRDRYVRFHAAQACVAFGTCALAITVMWVLAVASLVFMPDAFMFLMWVAALSWLAAMVLWGASIWNAATGRPWRIPLAAEVADRMV